ncbi:hypothetical protein J7M23_02430 [Candidatus Sumerlaeota bacterium]|nr:hypothetical protein [Candidatus Sumerlaeota bacterium]
MQKVKFWVIVIVILLNYIVQGKEVDVWFNHSVNSVWAEPTTNTAHTVDLRAKLIDFIASATTSLDIAVYRLSDSQVKDAIWSRFASGVPVRIIVDHDYIDEPEIEDLITSGVPVIDDAFTSPVYQGSYIFHLKFAIINARDNTNTEDDAVWVGSVNFTNHGFFTECNNTLEIKNHTLAQIYTTEFNEMWGSNSDSPDKLNAHFSTQKSDNTTDTFALVGTDEDDEVYFTPLEIGNVEEKIINAINSADYEIYFCIFTFTRDPIVNALKSRYDNYGVEVKGVFDNFGKNCIDSKFTAMQDHFGTDSILALGASSDIYIHHKYMLIDPRHPGSDPIVITGSANWTSSGFNYNDETVLIIHDPIIANQYLQEFVARFEEAGGSLTTRVNDWQLFVY